MPVVRLNDADIFYEEFGVGTPLLLIHGMLDTGRTLVRLAIQFSAHYRVIVPDLRGYGRSGPRPRVFPPDFYVRDAADMAALLRHLGLTEVRVIGVADGGEVALLLAIQEPTLLRALVAVSVTGALPPALLDLLPGIGRWVDEVSTDFLARRSEVIREYGLEGTRAIYRSWKEAVHAILAAGGEISLSRAGEIRCPVLIINGAEDTLNSPEMSGALAAAIPRAELRFVRDASQLISDKHRLLFAGQALAWLVAH